MRDFCGTWQSRWGTRGWQSSALPCRNWRAPATLWSPRLPGGRCRRSLLIDLDLYRLLDELLVLGVLGGSQDHQGEPARRLGGDLELQLLLRLFADGDFDII